MQKGFTLLAVLFILICLSIWGAILMHHLFWSQQWVNDEMLMTRAKFAGISGLALAQYQQKMHKADCPKLHLRFNKQYAALSGFEVDVKCIGNKMQVQASRGSWGNPGYVVWKTMSTVGN